MQNWILEVKNFPKWNHYLQGDLKYTYTSQKKLHWCFGNFSSSREPSFWREQLNISREVLTVRLEIGKKSLSNKLQFLPDLQFVHYYRPRENIKKHGLSLLSKKRKMEKGGEAKGASCCFCADTSWDWDTQL